MYWHIRCHDIILNKYDITRYHKLGTWVEFYGGKNKRRLPKTEIMLGVPGNPLLSPWGPAAMRNVPGIQAKS